MIEATAIHTPKRGEFVPVRYFVWDTHTNTAVSGPYLHRSRATSRMDRLDNAYGAYRYRVKPVPFTTQVECEACMPIGKQVNVKTAVGTLTYVVENRAESGPTKYRYTLAMRLGGGQ